MTITLEIPPETEAKLRAQAKCRGLTLDAFVKAIIAEHAATVDTLSPTDSVPPRGGQSDRAIDDVFDAVSVPPGVGEGSMQRANWYR